MDVAVAFGRAVKMRRAELDLSQEDVTDLTGLARSFLSGVECGRKRPTLDSVWRLTQALRCRPSDLWLVAERLLDEHGASPILPKERHLPSA